MSDDFRGVWFVTQFYDSMIQEMLWPREIPYKMILSEVGLRLKTQSDLVKMWSVGLALLRPGPNETKQANKKKRKKIVAWL